jgi:pseudouridine kinase
MMADSLAGPTWDEFENDRPVLAIGAAVVDILCKLKGEIAAETSNRGQIRSSFGGVARNVAENVARLGQPVQLLTVVGEDQAGQQLLEVTARAGVDVSSVLRTSTSPTCSYMAVINDAGKLHLAVDDMRTMSALTPEYVREYGSLFKEASLLFIDANIPKDTLRTVMSMARRAKLPVVADPTAAPLAHRFQRYLDQIFMITPNSGEAGVYCEGQFNPSNRKQAMAAAKNLVSQGVKIAIITLAEFGVCYATSQTSGYIPAVRTQIMDPTGAGDALSSAVIFGLLNQIEIDEAVRLAVTAASLTLSHNGAVLPDLSLEKLYDHLVI